MRRSASEIINGLEQRVARLEKQSATRYRTRMENHPESGRLVEQAYPVKPTFSERMFENTFEGLFEKALKRKGAKNINITFDADKKSFTHMSEFHGVNVYREDIPSVPVYSVGEGKLFFMLDGQPYEFPFYLKNTYNERQMALEIVAGNGKSHMMDLGIVLVVQYDWHEMDVVLSRNFDRAIETANEMYYGKRFARLEKQVSKKSATDQAEYALVLEMERQMRRNSGKYYNLKELLNRRSKLLDLDEIESEHPALERVIKRWVTQGYITIEGGEYEETRGGQSYPGGWDAYLLTEEGVQKTLNVKAYAKARTIR